MSDDPISVYERLLETPELFAAIEEEAGPEFAVQQRLRKRFDDAVVRLALTLRDLRKRGAAKFSRAGQMWFDRTGLEQSTPEAVARHKAARFAAAERPVLDLCSGIGADAIALAEAGTVLTVDRSPLAGWITRENARVYGCADRIEIRTADVTAVETSGRLVHIDPDRRPGGGRGAGQRTIRVEEAEPGLDYLNSLIETARGGAIKLSPAANFGGKFPECEVELTSLHGECKEATIWFGALRSESLFRATVLPEGATLAGDPWSARGPLAPLGRYLLDPDPAVVRGGLVDVACEQLGFSRLDPEEEYLTSDTLPNSPFVQAFEVLAELSNNDTELRSYFRGSAIGQVEIKCRHVPVAVEAVRRKLPLPGREAAVLIYARLQGRTRAVVARRVPRPGTGGAGAALPN